MKSIIKWAGSKAWLVEQLKELVPVEMLTGHTYIEPFAGSAAIAFGLMPDACILNDLNSELINLYQVAATQPEVLIKELEQMSEEYLAKGAQYYYEVRAWDRDPEFITFETVTRAARFMFLNRTCFNGLWRENSKGFMNSPVGRTATGKLPDIIQADKIRDASNYLNSHVKLFNDNYLEITKKFAKPGDVVYFDPPYDYVNEGGFVSYTKSGWSRDDLQTLKNECDRLDTLGCKFIVSNNYTPFVSDLFSDNPQHIVQAKRSINSKGSARGKVEEVLITNIN